MFLKVFTKEILTVEIAKHKTQTIKTVIDLNIPELKKYLHD